MRKSQVCLAKTIGSFTVGMHKGKKQLYIRMYAKFAKVHLCSQHVLVHNTVDFLDMSSENV